MIANIKMNYEINDEDPMMVAEPVSTLAKLPGGGFHDMRRRRLPLNKVAQDKQAYYEKVRDFCRAHYPEWIYKDLEKHDFMIDQPFPMDDETEEEMWERIERDSADESNYLSEEDFLKFVNVWDEWED